LAQLPAGVLAALDGVDLIVHAGDITSVGVLDQVRTCAPVVAVQGNHDRAAGLELPSDVVVRIGDVRIGVTHGLRGRAVETLAIGVGIVRGRPVMAGLARSMVRRFGAVECVVFGHFHLPYLARVGPTTVFSPGAVYVVESDPYVQAHGLRGRAFERFRSGIPASGRVPNVGMLEISGGVITPRIVPVAGPLRPVSP
jgi:putative phosphoesterase